MKDYYAILGVPRNAGSEQIKHAFRELARKWHPDVCSDPGAHERFVLIVEAYEVLSDPVARREYDGMWASRSAGMEAEHRRQKQDSWTNQGRERAREYAGISLDELLNGLNALAQKAWSGDDGLKNLSFGQRLAIGLNGWLLVVLIVLSFSVVAAPVTVSWGLHVTRTLYFNDRFIGFGRLLKCMLQAMLLIAIVAAIGVWVLNALANGGY